MAEKGVGLQRSQGKGVYVGCDPRVCGSQRISHVTMVGPPTGAPQRDAAQTPFLSPVNGRGEGNEPSRKGGLEDGGDG